MSTLTSRRSLQRLGLLGAASASLVVGIAPAASAATDVRIPLAPPEVAIGGFPIENYAGVMDPMDDTAAVTPVVAEFGDDLTVTLPAELDPATALVELYFDNDGDGTFDGTGDRTYTTDPAGVDQLVVTGQSTQTLTITLPTDVTDGPDAELLISDLSTGLSGNFIVDPLNYSLTLTTTATAQVDLEPALLAISQVPCAITSATVCPFPTPVTSGSTVTLELPTPSLLRDLGLTDLTGTEVGLQPLDAAGLPTGTAVALPTTISGSTATFVVPADAAAGSYALAVLSPFGTSASLVAVQLEVVAPDAVAAPVAPTEPAAPTAVNAGLQSNTGVEVVETGSTGSTGTAAVAAGAGLLLLAGVGGVAVARNRRRSSVEGGTCGA
ncbi:hypothetical protein [Modestobacter sp. SYSU DS0511]